MANEDKSNPEEVVETAEVSQEAEQAEAPESTVEEYGEETHGSPELAAKIASAKDEIAGLHDQLLRAQAEMQNVRRRAQLDVEKAHKFGLEKFANEMILVVDNLERSVEAFGDDESVSAIKEGVEMTLTMFKSSLEKFAVVEVNPQGEAFDPEKHQAMSMVPGGEGVAANTVVAVVQKGYEMNGRLLRPAMVMIAQG
ncbi:MAG: nucleotide exchange factor GrpE [Pontibacterium sp.]